MWIKITTLLTLILMYPRCYLLSLLLPCTKPQFWVYMLSSNLLHKQPCQPLCYRKCIYLLSLVCYKTTSVNENWICETPLYEYNFFWRVLIFLKSRSSSKEYQYRIFKRSVDIIYDTWLVACLSPVKCKAKSVVICY